MSENLRCPQCLLSSCVDCAEPGCPGLAGFVPLEKVLPDVKMMATMGREIRDLEEVVLLAGNLLAGEERNAEAGRVRVMNAALQIAGRRESCRKEAQPNEKGERAFELWWAARCKNTSTHRISLKAAMLDAWLAGKEDTDHGC